MESGEIRSQSHSGEYYWLGPDPTCNTQGQYIPIFPEVLITLTRMVLNDRSKVGITLSASCAA